MSDPATANLLETVRQLEARQDEVLAKLDSLNGQLELVLRDARPRTAADGSEPPANSPTNNGVSPGNQQAPGGAAKIRLAVIDESNPSGDEKPRRKSPAKNRSRRAAS